MENNVLAFNQSIAAGALVDVSVLGAEAGFSWPVGIAKELHMHILEQTKGVSEEALWEFLFLSQIQLREVARHNEAATELNVEVIVGTKKSKGVLLKAQLLVALDEDNHAPCVVFLPEAVPDVHPA